MPARLIDPAPPRASELPAAPSAAPARPSSGALLTLGTHSSARYPRDSGHRAGAAEEG
jgi:hypothetical protein